jgi:hypothetical protein
MGRTASRAQEAKARARAARLALLVERNAQDERIEEAVAAALVAWQDREAGQGLVEQAERDAAAALSRLSREKVLLRDMATLTGIAESVCARLLRLPVEASDRSRDGGPDGGREGASGRNGSRADVVG